MEVIAERMGISVETLKEAKSMRDKAEAGKEPARTESTSPETSSARTRSTRSSPSLSTHVANPIHVQPQDKASGKRKKNKSTRTYEAILEDEENELDEGVKEIKATGTQATKVTKIKSFGEEEKEKKKEKTDKPGMKVEEVENVVVKDGNLKPLYKWYEIFDES